MSSPAEGSLYSLAIGLYSAAVKAASPFNRKAKLMHRGHCGLQRRLEQKLECGARYIWVHAASLGEFEQGRPIMEWIRRERPEYRIVLTFFSPSGYEVRKNWPGADIVEYLPYDTPRRARRFIDAVKPEMAIFVKYEIWRNMLRTLADRHIPAYLVSAAFRPDQLFFRRSGEWYCDWLRNFRHIYVQDGRSAALLKSVGIDAVTVAGDTRFDRVTDIMRSLQAIPAVEAMLQDFNGKTVIFGSSWPADEAGYLEWLRSRKGNVKSVIAPHEFSPARIAKLREGLEPGLKVCLMSEAKDDPAHAEGADCLIFDCFGLLSSAYRYGDIAYVGGGFGAGIHNINEAAVYGIPVVFGPNNSKFIEARELVHAGGGYCAMTQPEIASILETLVRDEALRSSNGNAAGEYIRSKLGATQRIVTDIFVRR